MSLTEGLIFLAHCNNTWEDACGNNLDGTPFGATFQTSSPILGIASGYFDGVDDNVVTADSSLLDFGDTFSITGWIRPDTATYARRLISAGCTADGAYNLWSVGYGSEGPWGSGQRLNFARFNGSAYDDFNSDEIIITLGTKYLIGVVRSVNSLAFYLNNVPVGVRTISSATWSGSTGLIIGARYETNTSQKKEFANGLIDEVAIWNRALSTSELSELWNNGAGMEIEAGIEAPRRSRQMRSTFFR